MKSLQICLLSALLAIAASNPIPADEPAVPTVTPAVPDVTPAVKSVPEQPVVPAVAATELPSTQKSLPIDNERIPEPQALPSKKEEAPAKAEEKKREVTVEQPTAAPVEPQPDQVTGKSLPAQPAKDVVVEASTPKVEALAAESAVKSVTVEQPADAVPTLPAVAVVPEAKQAVDVTKAVESTVVPSAIASEKKIDAEAPVPIVSENVQPAVESVQPEQKSALPVVSAPVQVAPEQLQQQEAAPVPAQAQALAQSQERSAPESVVPVAAASAIEPTVAPVSSADVSSSVSSEKKIDDDSSSTSSEEESKESEEVPEKKQA